MFSPIFQHYQLNEPHSYASEQYFLPLVDTITGKTIFVFALSPLNQNLKHISQHKDKPNWFEEEMKEFCRECDTLLPENCFHIVQPSKIQIELFEHKLEKYDLYHQKLFLVIKSEQVHSQPQNQPLFKQLLHSVSQQLNEFIQKQHYKSFISHFLPQSLPSLQYSASIACGVKEVYLNDGNSYKFCYEGSGWVGQHFRKQAMQKVAGYMQMKQWEQFVQCQCMEGAVHERNWRSFKSIAQVGTMPWKNLHVCDVAFFVKKNQLPTLFADAKESTVVKITTFYHFQALLMEAYQKGNLLSVDLSTLFYYSKFFGCFTNQDQTFGMIVLHNLQTNQFIINNIFYTASFTSQQKIQQFENLFCSILHQFIFKEDNPVTILITTNEASPIYWHLRNRFATLHDDSFAASYSKWIKVITPLLHSHPQDLPITLSDKLFCDFREIHNGPMNQLTVQNSKL